MVHQQPGLRGLIETLWSQAPGLSIVAGAGRAQPGRDFVLTALNRGGEKLLKQSKPIWKESHEREPSGSLSYFFSHAVFEVAPQQ
jgi:hypothetical protein